MRISGCRLKEKTQDRLAEFFVGGVTARGAADLPAPTARGRLFLSSAASDYRQAIGG